MEVQGKERRIDLSDNLKVPLNSMELSYISFGGTKVAWNSMEYSMEFHGTKWYFIWRHQSSMKFHGIPWNTCVILNGAFQIPWNSAIFNLATAGFHGLLHESPGELGNNSNNNLKLHGIQWI